MMYLILGRTGSGKTHLAHLLENHGLSRVKSRTTRAPRSENEDNYIFVSEEEAAACQSRITDTVINGATYYTTPDDLVGKDFYIIDPIGAKKLAEAMPDETFVILYISAKDDTQRKEHATNRDDAYTSEAFDARDASEDEQFSAFEQQISDSTDMSAMDIPDNVRAVHVIVNDYAPETLRNEAIAQRNQMVLIRRIATLVTDAAAQGVMKSDAKGRILTHNRDGKETWHNAEEVALLLLLDRNAFYGFMCTMTVRSDRMSALDA